ncbi:Serine/threonine-protein phosphatase 6 regulatory ankyrin repeat subunit B [Hondaea fermentalgiana]|uniref:Serine/threonine-protein phosphatase 6 regulatory ankyrin repeat subunit B n=1 Tax=Hondaea fermentalgiana TaxID=2315210 RepID=A0A2R5GQN5_9STRA|nr:Serine/threonine-protein phosphatase 6 regulatory ankyrin repeat subunit B [Hondaea fermentalgiana]|eukprot:GBG33196.1 Serine/threonine-protein phosphatase 6 regulatory ankyrin repeat subunit B [Hondaea fermentalgiana]
MGELMRNLQIELLRGDEDALTQAIEALQQRELEGILELEKHTWRFVNRAINDHTGMSPLHVACMSGKESSVRAILKLHPDLCALDNKGRMPLHCAAESKSATAVSVLLAALEERDWAARSLGSRDERGLTPLHLSGGSPAVLRVLASCKNARTDLWKTPGLLRHLITSPNSAQSLRIVLGESPESADHQEIVPALTDLLNERDTGSGKSLFLIACEHGCAETCELLVARGADPLVCDNDGQNGLHWACLLGHDDVRDWLRTMTFAATLDAQRDASGRTPQEWVHESTIFDAVGPPPVPAQGVSPRSPKAQVRSSQAPVAWREDRESLDEAIAKDMESLSKMLDS